MNFRIPWIISRRRKIVAINIDFLLTICLYNYIFSKEFSSSPNKIVSISLGIFWVIISYVLGRYVKTSKITQVTNTFRKIYPKIQEEVLTRGHIDNLRYTGSLV